MAEDHRAAWAEVHERRRAAREISRARNTRALIDAGVEFSVLDNGWHLRIERDGHVVDFMPGPGTWSLLGDRRKRYGVHTLLRYLALGDDDA